MNLFRWLHYENYLPAVVPTARRQVSAAAYLSAVLLWSAGPLGNILNKRIKMNISQCLLLIFIFGSIISCNSPTQPIQTNNHPPSVTITARDSTLDIGDTLHLFIHVTDATLKTGI